MDNRPAAGQSYFHARLSSCYLEQVSPQQILTGNAWGWASVLAFAVALFTYPM
jgi:hypothetical protein